MAGPIAVDTPDYQRGIIHPQVLLATVAPNEGTVTVSLPANTETLLVQCWGGVVDPRITVVGTTTHYGYPGQKTNSSGYAFASPTYLFDVSPALDEQVTVTFNTAPTSQWSVYADSGAHTVVDLGACRDANGVQFMVPTAPSGGNWGHPLVELSLASGDLTGSGTMIAAPGPGQRLRIFALALAGHNAAGEVLVENGPGGTTLLPLLGIGPAILPVPLTGYPLSVSTALYMAVPAYGALWSAYYTTENV